MTVSIPLHGNYKVTKYVIKRFKITHNSQGHWQQVAIKEIAGVYLGHNNWLIK